MKSTEKTSPFYDPDSILVVVNKKCKWPMGYIPKDLVPVTGLPVHVQDWKLRKEAAEALKAMAEAAAEENVILAIHSGFRDTDFQTIVFEKSTKLHGLEHSLRYCALPGHSEHHTGLAADLGPDDPFFDLSESFRDTVQSDWLIQHAHEYGFILRYPEGKKDITGYDYEPWHYRYIGTEEAAKLHAAGKNMTMEEFYKVPGGSYENI